MKTVKIMAAALTACACASGWGATNYVDRAAGVDAAGRGGRETPFQSIQFAVEQAASGDTISVAPGVYDNGWGVDADGYTNRVYISGKTLIIRASGAREDTVVVGAKDPNDPYGNGSGIGPAAVRCVRTNLATGKYVIFEGLTFRGGACHSNTNGVMPGYAGGVCANGKKTYLVGCVLRDCTGQRGGAMYYGTMIRCLVTGCKAVTKADTSYRGDAVNCLVVENNGAQSQFVQSSVVNCTVDNVPTALAAETESKIYNTCAVGIGNIVGDSTSTAAGYVKARNSVFTLERFMKNGYATVRDCEACVTNATLQQSVAPLFTDYRLLPGAEALNVGDPAWLAEMESGLPEGIDLFRDYDGKPIPRTGKIHAGAIQTVADAPEGGLVVFSSKIAMRGGATSKISYTYAYATNYPVQWHIRAADDTKRTYCYSIDNYSALGYLGSKRYPEMDGEDGLWIMPPPAGVVMTNSVSYAKQVVYADPTASAEGADGTVDHPYPTLAAAYEKAAKSTPAIVQAAAGEYRSGSRESGGMANRLAITAEVLVRGAGAGRSFIFGEIDTTSEDRSEDGRGDNAMRCCYIDGGCVQGFTLAEGRSKYKAGSTLDVAETRGGGVLNASAGYLADCTITNCSAYRGGGVMYGRIFRCRITDCVSGNGVVRYGDLFACQIDGNARSEATLLGSNSKAYNCTVVTCSDCDAYGGTAAYNCICAVRSDVAAHGTVASAAVVPGSVMWRFAHYYRAEQDYSREDPCFVSETDDLRLLSSSSAIGCGTADDLWLHYSSDLEGNPMLFKNGRPTAGARQKPVQAVVVKKAVATDVLDKADGTYALAPGATFTVRASDTTRHVVALLVGEDDPPTRVEGDTWSFTAPAADETPAAPALATISSVYSTNWYVNANRPDDSGTGFTPETAKKTFKAVFENCDVRAYDCVHAAEGVYRDGEMDKDPVTFTRVVVKENVTVVADGDVEKTIIQGRASTLDPDAVGRGTNAVRCAFLTTGSVLKGFTITGGRTAGDGASNMANNGGGVYSESAQSLVVDCIISNNAASRGGGCHYGRYVNCRFFDNWALKNRAAASQAYLYGCVFDHNRGVNATQNCFAQINCTYGTDNLKEDGVTSTPGCSMPYGPVYNCLFLGTYEGASGSSMFVASSCVFDEKNKKSTAGAYEYTNCTFVARESLALDADYRPLAGCAAIDAGSNALAQAVGYWPDVDLGGSQRVYNGRIDCGAQEYDWREAFGRTMQGTVTVATPDVTLVDGRLNVTNRLETVLAGRSQGGRPVRYGVDVAVTGTGTLKVLLNGEDYQSFVAADGATGCSFKNALAENAVTFVYEPGADETDACGARVGPFWTPGGLLFVVR